DPARDPDLGLLALDLHVGPWGAVCALRVDEVRRPAAVASLGDIPRAQAEANAAVRRGSRARDRGRLLDSAPRAEPAARGPRLLRPHRALAGRPRLAVLALGLGPVPRPRDPGPPARPAGARGAARRGRARRGMVAAGEVAPPARGPLGCAPGRRRARADALVLPLPVVVLPVRGFRRARAADRRA